MDYICYDEETQTVESMVFQKDGSIKRQTLMSNLAMDKRIYFCDFNADGYVDVLLPFSHSSATGEYCYLVMAINDGKEISPSTKTTPSTANCFSSDAPM